MRATIETYGVRARRALRLATSVLCGVLLLLLMGVTVVDVVGRYQFDSPLLGGGELTKLLLMSVIFTGLPAICLDDGHIAVDLLTGRLRGRAAQIHLFIVRIFSAAVLAVMSWRIWEESKGMFDVNRITGEYYDLSGQDFRIPLGYFAQGAAALVAFSALITLVIAVLWLSKSGEEA